MAPRTDGQENVLRDAFEIFLIVAQSLEQRLGREQQEQLIILEGELGVSPVIPACPTLHRSTLGEQKQEQRTEDFTVFARRKN